MTVHKQRRRLLKGLVKGLGASAIAGLLPGCGPSQAPGATGGGAGESSGVIIIGAGMAGLTAANALINGGMDCVVLEGRDRIGGRLHTVDVGGSMIDLGGSWIHSPVGNPMSAFARQAGVLQTPADPQFDLATLMVWDTLKRSRLLPSDVALAVLDDQKFTNQSPSLLAALGPQASLKDAIELYLDRAQPSGDARRYAEFTIRILTETFESGPWEKIGFDNYVNAPIETYNGSEVGDFPVGGYVRLVNAMANGVPMDVRLQHEVTRVIYGAGGVSVDVIDHGSGSPVARSFRGSHVLVTVPLGVLKAGAIAFDPPLPAEKTSAIERVGFGTFEKVAMHFDAPFWETAGGTHLVHVDNVDALEWPLFLDLQRLSATPAMVALCTARYADGLLALDDAQVQASALAILQEVYGSAVTAPTAVAISRWRADPFTRGSYTYLPLGCTPDDLDTLALPVGERLLFAGEHTYKLRYGYADGSMSSGKREAARLLGTASVTITAG
jgi:polyamine oxidase